MHQHGCAEEHDPGDGCATSAIPFGADGSAWFTLHPGTGPVCVRDIAVGSTATLDDTVSFARSILDLAGQLVPSPRAAGAVLTLAAAALIAHVHTLAPAIV